MSTLVVSDLHLGTRSGLDLLRREGPRAALAEALDGIEEVVLLGDVLELREAPVAQVLAEARPALEALGRAIGPDRRVVLTAGNHDHRLVGEWVERRRQDPDAEPLRAEQRMAPAEASALAQAVADALRPARVEVAYPGVWLAYGVYATHGHYLDVHNTAPALETLAARAVERVLSRRGRLPDGVDFYEAVLGPVFAPLHELVQHVPGHASAGAGPSQRAQRILTGTGRRPLGHRLASGVAFPAFVAALNRAGLGPLDGDVSGPALRRAAVRAMGEVTRRLVPDAEHVIFGHTHRFGPLATDDAAEWTAPAGARLHNCGSWIFERFIVGGTAGENPGFPGPHPYWPGGAVRVEGRGDVRPLRLLADASREDLIGRPA
ncbi:MAG TPA: metallophosphoesterase [Solirubrobacteraceae bacterium]|nr:metallophosphoesterase [Solirubrobacteraceae bacterium]